MRGLAAVICSLVAGGAPTVDAKLVQFLVGKIAGVLEGSAGTTLTTTTTTTPATTAGTRAAAVEQSSGNSGAAELGIAARLSEVASELGAIASELEIADQMRTAASAASDRSPRAGELELLQSILAKIDGRQQDLF